MLPLVLATSKTPFFIGGGVLAIAAAVVAALGLRNPEFPGDARGQTAVMAVFVVLAVVAMGLAVYVA